MYSRPSCIVSSSFSSCSDFPQHVPRFLRHSVVVGQNEGNSKRRRRSRQRRTRGGLGSVAEECAREGEHGYKRKALPPCCCDITPQTFPSSFSLDLLTLLFLRISMEPRTLKQNIREIVDRKEVFAFEPRWGKKLFLFTETGYDPGFCRQHFLR